MIFLKSLAGTFRALILLSISIIISKCSDFGSEMNFTPAIKYYPKLPLNLINNTHISNPIKLIVREILKHTETCDKILNSELNFEKKKIVSNFTKNNIFLSFTRSIKRLNDWYKHIFNDILQSRQDTNFTTDTLLEINMNSILYSLVDINSFISQKSSRNSVDLPQFYSSISEFHKKQQDEGINSGMSIQQRLYSIHDCLSLTILNGYAIIFDAMKLLAEKNEYYSKQLVLKKAQLKDNLLSLARESRSAVKKESQIIRPRDPEEYQEGVNFEQLKHFIRAHVMGKDYLIKPHSCTPHTCHDVNRVNSREDFVGTKFQCNGFLYHCWSVSIQDICFPNDPDADRHYQAFMSDSKTIGPWNSNCSDKNVVSYKSVTEFTRTLLIPGAFGGAFAPSYEVKDCDICACYCDDVFNPKTIRKFSLQEVRSKHQHGVVTGIEFAIDHDAVVLKIRVGILVNGVVDAKKQGWQSEYVSTMNPNGKKLEKNEEKLSLSQNKHRYETVSLNFEWRKIFLDDVIAPPGTFIQGVKFIKCENGISLSILIVYFNERLEILPETAEWISSCDVKLFSQKRTEIIPHKDVPTKGKAKNKVNHKPESYIEFQLTDWEVDAGQTVIPFFDTQSVITDPPVPVSGVGLYYKDQENYGGFIGFQLHTFDFSYLMVEDMIDRDFEELFISNKKTRSVTKRITQASQ